MENIEAVNPMCSIKTGVEKRKKRILIKIKLKKGLAQSDQSFSLIYGFNGKIHSSEKIGKIIDTSL